MGPHGPRPRSIPQFLAPGVGWPLSHSPPLGVSQPFPGRSPCNPPSVWKPHQGAGGLGVQALASYAWMVTRSCTVSLLGTERVMSPAGQACLRHNPALYHCCLQHLHNPVTQDVSVCLRPAITVPTSPLDGSQGLLPPPPQQVAGLCLLLWWGAHASSLVPPCGLSWPPLFQPFRASLCTNPSCSPPSAPKVCGLCSTKPLPVTL